MTSQRTTVGSIVSLWGAQLCQRMLLSRFNRGFLPWIVPCLCGCLTWKCHYATKYLFYDDSCSLFSPKFDSITRHCALTVWSSSKLILLWLAKSVVSESQDLTSFMLKWARRSRLRPGLLAIAQVRWKDLNLILKIIKSYNLMRFEFDTMYSL